MDAGTGARQRTGLGASATRRPGTAATTGLSLPNPMDGEKLCPVGVARTDRGAIGLRGARIRRAAGPRRRRVGSVVTVPATWTIRVGVGIGCIAGVRRQEFVEFVIVEAGSVERIAPTA